MNRKICTKCQKEKQVSEFSNHQRCTNPKNVSFDTYGKRNIKNNLSKEEIKSLWFRDKAYLLDRPSIDRIDNNGNYELGNCRFIELRENARKGDRR